MNRASTASLASLIRSLRGLPCHRDGSGAWTAGAAAASRGDAAERSFPLTGSEYGRSTRSRSSTAADTSDVGEDMQTVSSTSPSSPSSPSSQSPLEKLFGIRDREAWVEGATANRYVKERLKSVLASNCEVNETSSETFESMEVSPLTSLFRYHNSSMLQQLSQGHMIKATVVKVDARKAILDLRNGKFATIGVHELNEDSVLERNPKNLEGRSPTTPHPDSQPRTSSAEASVYPGDTVQVFLESIETPEGDILIRGQETAVSRRGKAVWQELLERLKDGRPVKGRLLNSLAGGYSVGVAGIVCFLPNRNASKVTVSRIGELSEYRVIQMNASRSNVVLSDCRLDRQRGAGEKRGKRGGGRRGGELLRY